MGQFLYVGRYRRAPGMVPFFRLVLYLRNFRDIISFPHSSWISFAHRTIAIIVIDYGYLAVGTLTVDVDQMGNKDVPFMLYNDHGVGIIISAASRQNLQMHVRPAKTQISLGIRPV